MKTKQKLIGSIVVLLFVVIFLIVGYALRKPKTHKFNEEDIFVESLSNTSAEKVEIKSVTVCIKGEVINPGVYTLKAGSIVEDLIKKAGGYTEEANKDSKLNLARKLKDEDYIYVDKKQEPAALASAALSGSISDRSDGKININSATLSELDKVPGIGPVTAQKIIDYREKHGAFNSIEDLRKLGGMGDKTIEKFRAVLDIR